MRPDRFLYVRSYYGKLAAPARGWWSGTVAWDGRQKASAQPSPGRAKDNQLGSAVDTLTTGSRAIVSPTARKRHAVAHEVPVDITGAKAGLNTGKRELFAESTSSVLVFENGGVIRLAADVAPGQLLFLTHTAAKREVVAEVTRKHALGSGFIEVEFTQPAPGFWGVDFPSEPQAAQTPRAGSAPAAALLEAIEKADQETPAPPKVAEVARLRSEVDVLREQLESIQRQPAATPAPADASLPTPPCVAKKTKEEALDAADIAKEVAKIAEIAPSHEAAEAEPESTPQDLLPKAALNVSRADAVNALSPELPAVAPGGSSAGRLRLVLLAGVLLALLGGAWYQGWISGLPRTKARPAEARTPVPSAAARPAAESVQKPGAAAAALTGTAFTGPTASRSDTATAEAKSAVTAPPTGALAETEAEPETSRGTPGEGSALPAPRAASHSSKAAPAEKAGGKGLDGDDDSDAASENEQGVLPPKLLHSVRAVPPPEAVRQFATGNVILDAVVDTTGHVKSLKVVSGPPSLRNAAVDALKQYKYTPAKRHGKTIAAHLQVTVQFWYEP